jgi:hypothetical protein
VTGAADAFVCIIPIETSDAVRRIAAIERDVIPIRVVVEFIIFS